MRPRDLWGRGWGFAAHIPSAAYTRLVLQGLVNNFDHLLSLANRARPSPSSLLYSQIDAQFVGFAEAVGFQEDWLEVAREMWGTPKGGGSSARLGESSITLGA